MQDPKLLMSNELRAVPYCCYRCRSISRPYFVDTGMDTEYDGRIYICSACLHDFISVVDTIHTEQEMIDLDWKYRERITEAAEKEKRYDFLLGKFKEVRDSATNIIKREEKALYNERRKRTPDSDASVLDGAERESDDSGSRTEPDDSTVESNPNAIVFPTDVLAAWTGTDGPNLL